MEEVKQIVQLDEDAYLRDSPLSVGKSLVLKSLEFSGQKSNGDPIHYTRPFGLGLNMWVGDNLVGKSSIFNLIKLALTGRNRHLSKDVKKWISEVWLEFAIGQNSYTVHVKIEEGDKYTFSFYNRVKEDIYLKTTEETSQYALFAGGKEKYEEAIQNFFFQELRYYSLQWTQNSSRKSNPQLDTSNASWPTYFHSIFLEADEYDKLVYGNQPVLILQMLFVLELTFPFNRLKIEKEHLERELGLLSYNQSANPTESNKAEEQDKLEKQLSDVETKLIALQEKRKEALNVPDLTVLTKQLEKAKKKYIEATNKQRQLYASRNEQGRLWEEQDKRNRKLKNEIDEYEVELTKQRRKMSDVREEIEIGAFFAGLEVQTCPYCSHQVRTARIKKEKVSKRCRLCDEELEVQEVNLEDAEKRVAELRDKEVKLRQDQYRIQIEKAAGEREIKKIEERQSDLSNQLNALPLDGYSYEIERLESEIKKKRPIFDQEEYWKNYEAWAEKKIKLNHQISLIGKNRGESPPNSPQKEQIVNRILVLKCAMQQLDIMRESKGRRLFERFETLYLQLLRDFGLQHYEKVTITSDFKIEYVKHGEVSAFEDISPGEKLLAKLGLYIALIQMDVEYQLGKHPGFIILDSPAQEEGDDSFVEGLKDTLSLIEKKFGEKLQIFIGTAERDLSAIDIDSSKVEIRGKKEYFF